MCKVFIFEKPGFTGHTGLKVLKLLEEFKPCGLFYSTNPSNVVTISENRLKKAKKHIDISF